MTVGPASGHSSFSAGPAHAHTELARWAVGLAEVAAGILAVGFAVFGIAYAVGGADATADNWVGILTVAALATGLMSSLLAFALAGVAKVRHDRWSLLWLPLTVFPALVAFLALGEAFWWE